MHGILCSQEKRNQPLFLDCEHPLEPKEKAVKVEQGLEDAAFGGKMNMHWTRVHTSVSSTVHKTALGRWTKTSDHGLLWEGHVAERL